MRASIISNAAGSTPAAMMPLTAGRGFHRVERAQHRGDVRSVGREPHRDPGRDAHRPLRADEATPQVVARGVGLEPAEPPWVPSASTTSTASTSAEVTPSARQCGPPTFVPTLPPIVQACCDDGSGA